ncbi:hypothetical protein OIU76_006913 [Salix suchowensis]|nr:hypothetical protein OIU76_006913 [Salix suchowensis]
MFRRRNLCRFLRKRKDLSLLVSTVCLGDRSLSTISLGGGKSADVLLWRNKKISAGFLTGATAIWVLFEWLNYHFLSLICFVLALGMLAQFIWINASGLFKRSPSQVPRLVLPDDIFVSFGRSVGAEVNRALQFLQDLSCGGNLKQFLVVGLNCDYFLIYFHSVHSANQTTVLYSATI